MVAQGAYFGCDTLVPFDLAVGVTAGPKLCLALSCGCGALPRASAATDLPLIPVIEAPPDTTCLRRPT